tara:strand:+ start:5173 stop:5739 length:567 start_codon:yes stop_codon:yes gene_type:complete
MILTFFDTETTGFANSNGRIMQFAATVVKLHKDFPPRTVMEFSTLVKGDVAPNVHAQAVHGIDLAETSQGITDTALCRWFTGVIDKTDILIAHNLKFDLQYMKETYDRLKLPMPGIKRTLCTMEITTPICRIPKARGAGHKWPKLEEAYRHLLGKPLDGAHDALVDTRACRDILLALLKDGKVTLNIA